MPRDTSAAFDAEIDKPITAVGYLMQINASQTLRWCDIGDQTYMGFPWVDVDMEIKGLRWEIDRDVEFSFEVSNLDNAVAAIFLTEQMADVTVDLWQFARGALADGDAVHIARCVIDSCRIKPDRMEASCSGQASMSAFSPRRRIDSTNGFKFALPRGTVIQWGGETFVTEQEENG